jgi:next-to-BRCA1 protein 1
MPASAEQSTSSETEAKATTLAPSPPPKYEPVQNEPLRPSYLQTVLAPSSHGSRAASSAAPSIQSLYASAAAGLSSFEDAQRKEMQDRAKLRLEAELRAEKDKAAAPRDFTLPARPKQPSLRDSLFPASFAIDCNNCGTAIANEHYHCSICESGDFDLCQACVDSGITCDGKDHWLIKRFQQGGSIIPSVTETIAPKVKKADEPKAETVKEEKPEVLKDSKYQGDRTCNSCINGKLPPSLMRNLVLTNSESPGEDFVSCDNCPDFDLCVDCFAEDQHGHHPAHSFRPVSEEKFAATSHLQTKFDAGRGVVHEALCDGCDKVS